MVGEIVEKIGENMVCTTANGAKVFTFYCEGCKCHHSFQTENPQENGACWSFDGNHEAPSFSPSLLCNKDYPESRCHLFLKKGQVQYLGDCHHELAGSTVPLAEFPNIDNWL